MSKRLSCMMMSHQMLKKFCHNLHVQVCLFNSLSSYGFCDTNYTYVCNAPLDVNFIHIVTFKLSTSEVANL